MSIFVRVQFDVADQLRAEFEQLALALREQAQDEPGTLTYRFFTAGTGSYIALEEYADTAAALAHQERAADLLEQVGQCAELVRAELYGPIGPELREWVRSRPQATSYADLDFPGRGDEA